MLRIRHHGRGGQGIKTASQILGSAAFYSGFQVQDFPLYGAERRGAPIIAGARIDRSPILERGPIIHPDILLVGDETLLEDPLANPLAGADDSTLIFINSTHPADQLKKHFKFTHTPIAVDLTELGERHIRHGRFLSASLAAAGARLMGNISLDCLLRAVRSELLEHGVSGEVLEKNLDLAREIFERVEPKPLNLRKNKTELRPGRLVHLQQRAVKDAAPIIMAAGNMGLKKTGNWRMERPVINYEKCNDCLICFVRCPDGAVGIREDCKPEIDYDHCKGCLVCAQECPTHAIDILKGAPSWA